ncbi:acyl-CoA N-acyltransferase [Globomyces pollinis-pini]|nr:acyl-CoA N-acyltransferase [Globomyces pollinis-pini]
MTFWEHQPVQKVRIPLEIGTIIQLTDLDLKPQNIEGFNCTILDLNDEVQLTELHLLLLHHYVSHSQSGIKLNYSKEFIKWSLMIPGYNKEFHIALRDLKTNSMIGFIGGVPIHCEICTLKLKIMSVNFLCLHKNVRNIGLAPKLINHLVWKMSRCNIHQAIYTGGKEIHMPLLESRYHYRTLNSLEYKSGASKLRSLELKDCDQVLLLLTNFMGKYKLKHVFSIHDIIHLCKAQNHPNPFLFSYVQEDENQEIKSFISFYSLPLSVTYFKPVYLYYYAYTDNEVSNLSDMIHDAMHLAKSLGFDSFNVLDVMDTHLVLQSLKFQKSDQVLKYFCYNFQSHILNPNQCGLLIP